MLRRRLLPAGRPGTWRTLWAGEDAEQVPRALADLASPPLFGGPQVLAIRRAETLGEDDQGHLLDALPRLGAGGCLVLVARTADQRRRVIAACQRAGAAFGFGPVTDPRTLAGWVVRLAKEQGSEIAAPAVDELVERIGADLGALAGEVEKLALHAGAGHRIEITHVRALVAAIRAHGVEELTDRLARRDLVGAARTLRHLLAEGEPPIKLVAFLAANLRRALHVAELAAEGLTADQIGTRLGMPHWLVSRNTRRTAAADLARALVVLERLDLELKSSRPAEAVFDAALLEIIPTRDCVSGRNPE